jgi:hypothetical protein
VPLNAGEGCTKPGLRLFPMGLPCWLSAQGRLGLSTVSRHLLGNSPHKSHKFSGNGRHHLVDVFASGMSLR